MICKTGSSDRRGFDQRQHRLLHRVEAGYLAGPPVGRVMTALVICTAVGLRPGRWRLGLVTLQPEGSGPHPIGPSTAAGPIPRQAASNGGRPTKLATRANLQRHRRDPLMATGRRAAGGPAAGEDNVAVAARPNPQGVRPPLRRRGGRRREPIAHGAQVAVREIAAGDPIRKYGQIIGFAARPIPAGAWVHVHNVKADLFERDYAHATERPPVPP